MILFDFDRSSHSAKLNTDKQERLIGQERHVVVDHASKDLKKSTQAQVGLNIKNDKHKVYTVYFPTSFNA